MGRAVEVSKSDVFVMKSIDPDRAASEQDYACTTQLKMLMKRMDASGAVPRENSDLFENEADLTGIEEELPKTKKSLWGKLKGKSASKLAAEPRGISAVSGNAAVADAASVTDSEDEDIEL